MKLEHIIRKLYYEPMCITPNGHAALRNIVEKKLSADFKLEDGDTDFFGDPFPQLEVYDNLAIIPVVGPITQHASLLERTCGVVGVSQIREMIDQATSTAGVDTLVFNFNSPGGTVTGVPELANEIVALGKKYKTIGYTDSLAASAAFWLFAATDERYAAPTADLLSVGVYSYVLNTTEYYKKEGIRVDLFTSGDLKGIGIPGVDMTDMQKEHMQEEVDKIGKMFRTFVKERIPRVKDEHMRGQTLMANELLEHGVVHGLNHTISEIFGS